MLKLMCSQKELRRRSSKVLAQAAPAAPGLCDIEADVFVEGALLT